MPITLITGLPGHGKTLYALSRIKEEADKEGRPVFQCSGQPDPSKREGDKRSASIAGLRLPWPEIDPMRWWEAPPRSIVLIDEAQVVFPIRGRGEPPEWIQRLSTHRHLGIDIVLITQGPMLIDSFVRQLVDRHFHVVRKFGTHFATVHEYANGCRDLVLKSRGDESIRHEWRYPKEVFGWYTSAEVHTVKRRIPMKVWLILAAPLVALALGFFAFQRLKPSAQGEAIKDGVHGPTAAATPAGREAPAQRAAHAGPVSREDYLASHVPRVAGLAYTAPLYDEVTKAVQAPYPAACVVMRGECRCYSQQATRLDMGDDLCRGIVAKGFFVAWQQPAGASPGSAAPAAPARPQEGAPGPVGIDGRGLGIIGRQPESSPLGKS